MIADSMRQIHGERFLAPAGGLVGLVMLVLVIFPTIAAAQAQADASEPELAEPAERRVAAPQPGESELPASLPSGRKHATPRAAASRPVELPDGQTVGKVREAIAGLDADVFLTRQAAAAELDQLVDDHRLDGYLATEFRRRLLAPDTSFEVRTRLEQYLKSLPAVPATTEEPRATVAEIGPLLNQLDSDRSLERDTAQRRLEVMPSQLELLAPLLLELKRRLADPGVNLQTRRILESVLDTTREAWVNADPASIDLPPVPIKSIVRLLDDYLEPPALLESAGRARRETAHRDLIDLLVRDDTRPRLLQLLDERLAATDNAEVGALLRDLADFAKPAMAAEVWGHQTHDPTIGQIDDFEHRQHIAEQYLLVGVPQMAEGALRPTHFDRIDDQTAHCVSGNSLKPGDYPVGAAIPHPDPSKPVMYYLVNLPSPRRRLAYAYYLRRSEAERLLEISQQTLDYLLVRRQPLDEPHLTLLQQLDPHVVSRWVGAYFQAVPDQPLLPAEVDPSGQATLHRLICSALVHVGTHEAVPALEQLARSDESLKPNYNSPFYMPWVAALAIAKRDPWPGVDEWLAGLIDETEPLVSNADPVPDLGATAAGLLVERHDASPYSFELEPADNGAFDESKFAGYHFVSDAGRKSVLQWWEKRKRDVAEKSAP